MYMNVVVYGALFWEKQFKYSKSNQHILPAWFIMYMQFFFQKRKQRNFAFFHIFTHHILFLLYVNVFLE